MTHTRWWSGMTIHLTIPTLKEQIITFETEYCFAIDTILFA